MSVSVEPQFSGTLSEFVDLSLFARTRRPTGLLFYLGSDTSEVLASGGVPTYLAAELSDGRLQVRLKLSSEEEVFEVPGPRLDDGVNNLIRVSRSRQRGHGCLWVGRNEAAVTIFSCFDGLMQLIVRLLSEEGVFRVSARSARSRFAS